MCVYRGVGKCESEKPLKVVNQIYNEGGGDEELPIPDMVGMTNFSTQEAEAGGASSKI